MHLFVHDCDLIGPLSSVHWLLSLQCISVPTFIQAASEGFEFDDYSRLYNPIGQGWGAGKKNQVARVDVRPSKPAGHISVIAAAQSTESSFAHKGMQEDSKTVCKQSSSSRSGKTVSRRGQAQNCSGEKIVLEKRKGKMQASTENHQPGAVVSPETMNEYMNMLHSATNLGVLQASIMCMQLYLFADRFECNEKQIIVPIGSLMYVDSWCRV